MTTSEECEQKAAECLRLARVMSDVTHKALLLKMALAWVERAKQIKARSDQDGASRGAEMEVAQQQQQPQPQDGNDTE